MDRTVGKCLQSCAFAQSILSNDSAGIVLLVYLHRRRIADPKLYSKLHEAAEGLRYLHSYGVARFHFHSIWCLANPPNLIRC